LHFDYNTNKINRTNTHAKCQQKHTQTKAHQRNWFIIVTWIVDLKQKVFFFSIYYYAYYDFSLIKYFFHSMLIPKKNRVAIYEYLFKEGVCVAKRDGNSPKHPHIENVPNLHVMEAMKVGITVQTNIPWSKIFKFPLIARVIYVEHKIAKWSRKLSYCIMTSQFVTGR